MTPYRAVMLDKDNRVADALQSSNQKFVELQVQLARTIDEFRKAIATSAPDVVLLQENSSVGGVQALFELRKSKPSIPVVLLCEAASAAWEATIDDRATEVLCNPVSIQELKYRIAKLLRKPIAKSSPYQTRITVRGMAALRNDQSGRLDAKKIARVFGMTLADLARSIGRSLQSVHRTPDSKAMQKELFFYERIASAISRISNSNNALKVWLNSANESFPDKLPIDLVIDGHGTMLADLLEDVLLGHPD